MRHGWKRLSATLLHRRACFVFVKQRFAVPLQSALAAPAQLRSCARGRVAGPTQRAAVPTASTAPNAVCSVYSRGWITSTSRQGQLGINNSTKGRAEKNQFPYNGVFSPVRMLLSSTSIPPPSWPSPSGHLTSTPWLRRLHSAPWFHSHPGGWGGLALPSTQTQLPSSGSTTSASHHCST